MLVFFDGWMKKKSLATGRPRSWEGGAHGLAFFSSFKTEEILDFMEYQRQLTFLFVDFCTLTCCNLHSLNANVKMVTKKALLIGGENWSCTKEMEGSFMTNRLGQQPKQTASATVHGGALYNCMVLQRSSFIVVFITEWNTKPTFPPYRHTHVKKS